MAQPLLPNSSMNEDQRPSAAREAAPATEMADLKIFWGPEICRLEYLVHLLDTGRVKDEYRRGGA